MTKIHQAIAVSFLVLVGNFLFAAVPEKKCNKTDWSCHGPFYLTAGYVFAHNLFNKNQLSFSPPNRPSINFTPANAYPNNFSGVRLGFGSGLGTNLPFTYELDYTQLFTQSHTTNSLKISRSTKTFVGILGYVLNPKDRLRTSIVGGASIISSYMTQTTLAPRHYFSQTTNAVDVDPFLGASLSYQINSKLALRAVEFYDFATYNKSATGNLVTLLMLNYYPA
ncbi:hypothetical protein [Legionella sp. km772]|uniref:hypothetical protein n=1 Tax=Legionella sp. km772 TaxID=2498111 RepID=UPI000F8E44D7|nr:hypothetical protein [Legionella sp. km772]RUR09527.1 hypothetical protein ELY15_09125 [Legionella sp. km772]